MTNYTSILMPVRNEGQSITRCLDAALAQNYLPEKLEVLVADGMSDDGTRDIIRGYQEKHPNLRLVDNPGRIVPTGMNAALKVARGEIIVRVDGHTIIAPDYVSKCVEALQRSGADNVGGRMNAAGKGAFGEAVAVATSSPFGVGGARFHYSELEEWVDTVYMGAWPRRVFDEIGMFDEELVRDQDDELNYRLREHGGRILLCPEIKSQYTVRSSPKALWKQYFQYGYWKVRVMQKHPKQMRMRQFVPPAFVTSLLLSAMLAVAFPVGRLLLGGIVGMYVLCNLMASVYTASKAGWSHLVLLPVVYAILHLSYGMGFVVGMVRFAGRWRDRMGRVPAFPESNV